MGFRAVECRLLSAERIGGTRSTALHYDRTVIAHHGCEAEVAERVLAGEPFKQSENEFDWLGHGVYFWEYGLDRALRWAEQRYKTPAAVGAIIQLGNCFDLLDTRATYELSEWAVLFASEVRKAKMTMPCNVGSVSEFACKLTHAGRRPSKKMSS
jgi:hypothetical protein